MSQLELIADEIPRPDGFLYRADFISADEETRLVGLIADQQFSAVVMRGVAAKRRTAHFGRSYEFESFKLGAGATDPGISSPAPGARRVPHFAPAR